MSLTHLAVAFAASSALFLGGAHAAPPGQAAPTKPAPSRDFPQGTATPSEECGACHLAIYREYAHGFGSDMRYPGIVYRTLKDKALTMPAGVSVAASAHAVAGVDPFPIHARGAEEEGKACNVCHFPAPWRIPPPDTPEVARPRARAAAQAAGITCASCHLTPEGTIRGPDVVTAAPHATTADPRIRSSEMCAHCHALGKRVIGKQTQTYLEWRDDFAGAGLGRQQCQDCHMSRTRRKTAEDYDVPVRAVARHLWTGGHSAQRLGSALSLVIAQKAKERADLELHVINVGAGHSVPTGSNRRAVYLRADVLAGRKVVATKEWLFAPWYGNRPDDRAFLAEDKKRPDAVAAIQADEQGPHEPPIRAGEERVLAWQPALRAGRYTVVARLVYDLNRYNDRAFAGDQRELSRTSLPLAVK
ncbi:MAG: hypothetical protein HY906_03265 [Deltaproteobacteria bacterium]|nr:hypothetical protein [Deltaproteobacteria bacterium]